MTQHSPLSPKPNSWRHWTLLIGVIVFVAVLVSALVATTPAYAQQTGV